MHFYVQKGHEFWRKNGHNFMKNCTTAKFQIYWPPSEVWVSIFPSVDRNAKLALAIMIKWKNGCHFTKSSHTTKIHTTDHPQFGSQLFLVSTEIENWHQPLWKKWENGWHSAKQLSYVEIPNYWSLQSLGLCFSYYWKEQTIGTGYYEKLKKWLPFCEKLSYSEIPNYSPLQSLGLHFS